MKKDVSVCRQGVARSSAIRKVASAFLTVTALILFSGLVVQNAYAHHVITAATASCSNGVAVINYTVTSWDPGDTQAGSWGAGDGDNPNVEVLFNGVPLAWGAFIPTSVPPDQFSGTVPAPLATTSVDVEGIAVANWGDGYVPKSTDPNNIVTVTIPTNCAPGTGRFTGGGKQVAVGIATVTKGFEVDCDLHQPSNNLEVNWKDSAGMAHQFHMTAFTSAACSLQNNPSPPPAPVNTILGTGTGRYDGADGYTIMFELVDNGEPGTHDEAAFLVYLSNPATPVLNVPLAFITGGNVQAHVDQK